MNLHNTYANGYADGSEASAIQINDLKMVLKGAKHLLLASKAKTPGGPTDYEETKERLIKLIDKVAPEKFNELCPSK